MRDARCEMRGTEYGMKSRDLQPAFRNFGENFGEQRQRWTQFT